MDPDINTAAQRRCHLLEIPEEIRLEIYGYLLKPWKLHVRSYAEYSTSQLSEREITTSRFYGKVLDKILSPQLLQVCKKIHREALPVLAEPYMLSLVPSTNREPPRVHRRERPIDISLLNPARRIKLIELRITSLPHTATDDIVYSRVLAKQFHDELKVHNLHLTVDDVVTDDPWEGLQTTPNATRLADIHELLRVWSKLQARESFIFSLDIVGVTRGLHWHWESDRKSTQDWKQERGLNNDSDDYDDDRLNTIIGDVKTLFPVTKEWKGKR